MSILFIVPPVSKPSEPLLGVPRLIGHLRRRRVSCSAWDANVEGLLYLLSLPLPTREKRARKCLDWRDRHLEGLRAQRTYQNVDRYRRTVKDLSHLLGLAGELHQSRIRFSDFQHARWQPLRSSDLLQAADHPEANPFFSLFSQRLPQLLESSRPAWVGISITYLSQALSSFAILGFLKRTFPELKVVLGGGLITSWMKRPSWKNPFSNHVDLLVSGPGEEVLDDLFSVQKETSSASPESTSLPDYSDFPWNLYLSPGRVLPYNTSFGCHWNRCAFCPEKAEGRVYKPSPPLRVAEELQELRAFYQPSLIHLTDNAIPPSTLRKLAEISPGPPWYGFVRCQEQLTDPAFARQLKESGCCMLKLGVESGDPAVLKNMKKGFTPKRSSRVLRTLSEAGIATYVYLLFGTPWEDEESALRTLSFVEENHESVTFINPSLFRMPRFETTSSSGETTNDLSLYQDFNHEKGWDRRRVRHFLDRSFKKSPRVARILRRTPLQFTSNHAPFLVLHRAISSACRH